MSIFKQPKLTGILSVSMAVLLFCFAGRAFAKGYFQTVSYKSVHEATISSNSLTFYLVISSAILIGICMLILGLQDLRKK